MKLVDLKVKLNELGVNPDSYSLTGSTGNECYVLSQECSGKWSVFYSERGLQSCRKIYETEDEACRDLFKRLGGDPTVLL